MENERKKFNLFGFLDKDGKGVEKGDELKVLENYLPWDMSGLQKKLIQGE